MSKADFSMQEGDFWRVFIHPDLAYGEEGRPTIPPNSALIFDIKLHAISQNLMQNNSKKYHFGFIISDIC